MATEKLNLYRNLIILAICIVIAFFLGNGCGSDRKERRMKPQIESYQAQIDSLRFRIDTMSANIDPEFAEKERVIYKTKYKYIIEKQENEKQEYFSLDTSGRVAVFRQRVRGLTDRK